MYGAGLLVGLKFAHVVYKCFSRIVDTIEEEQKLKQVLQNKSSSTFVRDMDLPSLSVGQLTGLSSLCTALSKRDQEISREIVKKQLAVCLDIICLLRKDGSCTHV